MATIVDPTAVHRPRNVDWKRAAALLYGDWGTSKASFLPGDPSLAKLLFRNAAKNFAKKRERPGRPRAQNLLLCSAPHRVIPRGSYKLLPTPPDTENTGVTRMHVVANREVALDEAAIDQQIRVICEDIRRAVRHGVNRPFSIRRLQKNLPDDIHIALHVAWGLTRIRRKVFIYLIIGEKRGNGRRVLAIYQRPQWQRNRETRCLLSKAILPTDHADYAD